ncbi:MAG: aromatic amino acid lyase, partial [Thermoanaerobaculia bacterium]
MSATIVLDGNSLTIEQLVAIARDPSVLVARDPAANQRIALAEALIATVVANYRSAYESGSAAPTEYGVTTGFGEFKDKPIAPQDLVQLQRNLLLSHSVGVGENIDADDLTNYYAPEVIRGALATRLNAFLKGHSGVRVILADAVEQMLNRGVIPLVPLRGSVGASGDLCPLSHLFATLLGAGRFYLVDDAKRTLRPATDLPAVLGMDAEVIKPSFKEGLGLVNGANFSAAMLALA